MYKKIIVMMAFFLTVSIGTAISVQADNPVIKDEFSADPAAISHNGKAYLYTGHDEAAVDGNFFVLKEWSIYSSTDLNNWKREGALPRTAFSWAKNDSAWASQVIERNGKFYWYVTVFNGDADDPGYSIGVAQSDDPVSGWEDARNEPLVSASMTEDPASMGAEPWDDIDPTVFIDEDGQAYLYWGNTHLYYAKLKENMIELEGDIHRLDIQNIPGTFTEAPWLHEHNGIYYLSFAMNYPEELAYATSDSPEGPWEYQGLLMDTLPGSATSHPAILDFQGQSYFIYHTAALPTGGEYRRSVSIEKLHYNPDGTIRKMIPTASGFDENSYAIQSFDQSRFVRHLDNGLRADPVEGDTYDFKWHVVAGLAEETEGSVSFQSENNPGNYLVRDGTSLTLAKDDGTDSFAERATFIQEEGLADSSWSSYKTLHDELYMTKTSSNVLSLQAENAISDPSNATFRIQNADAKEVSVSQDSLAIIAGSTAEISAQVLPKVALNDKIAVHVENQNIVEVGSTDQQSDKTDITLKGKQAGMTTVTLSSLDGNHQTVITVEVQQIEEDSFGLEDVSISANSTTKDVEVSGSISHSSRGDVTIKVVDPEGEVDFLDQVSSTDDGRFAINFMLNSQTAGKYLVSLGINENDPYQTSFTLSNPDSTEGGSNDNQNEQDETENETNKNDTNNDTSGKGNAEQETNHETEENHDLPDTATNLFQLLMIGGLLIVTGLMFVVVHIRKENTE
ncbi:family 43 glycosylhydrolase [Gracilibacillus caseinilyticus]|uniref:Family 43 glycosylhydrolase n=1 Tax=Gracilibacillus caseinilyticus TaxID=2932256 RepID=A0ABY4F0D2_9BACI|nr:family 43 glycosylhydrolase [Gracilibacillus caseinilyticus]UOQ50121.1 family 43 glycosylhydrolase [Gracilibacillus caseinilyticus]